MVRVGPQEPRRLDTPPVHRAESWAKERVLVNVSQGPRVLVPGAFEGRRGFGGPCPFSQPE